MKFVIALILGLVVIDGNAQNALLHFLGPDRIGYSWVDEVHDADVFILDKDQKSITRFITAPIIMHSNFTPVPLVIFPSDDLNISFAKKEVTITSKNNPIRNYEQSCTKEMARRYGELVFMDFKSADNIRLPETSNDFAKTDKRYFEQTGNHLKKQVRSLAERDSLLYTAYRGRLSIIDSCNKKHGLSNEYVHFMSQVVLYRYLYFSLLGYQLMHAPDLPASLQKYVDDPSLQNDSLVGNINMYRAFYLTLNRYQASRNKKNADAADEIENAVRTLHGKTKDNVIMSIVHAELQQKKADKTLLTAFYKNCTDSGYVRKINGMAMVFDKSDSQNTMLISLGDKKTSFETLLKSMAGKTVVVDFWASWCAPCLKELPSYRALMQKTIGKPVAYIFLSMDDDAGNWKKSAASFKDFMNESNSFVIVNGTSSPLSKKYSISTIPRIMIFNEKGDVSYLKAPGASEPGLASILSK